MYLGRADKILSITTKDKDWAATETEIGFGRVSTPADLALPADQITDGPAFLAAGSDAINAFVPTCLIGSVFAHTASDTYVPNGCVPADGAEYAESQFPTFYTDYLVAGKLVTCTYTEFSAQVAATGNCAKFALDVDNQTFKVPLYKDGDSITQAASAAEIGKSYEAGLPNATGGINDVGTLATITNKTGVFSSSDVPGTYGYAGGNVHRNYVHVNFSLASANTIYGNSNTVTDEQVRLRHFVVLASAQNNSSMFDWSAYMSALAGKANKDLDNLTQAGTTAIAHYGMPSNTRQISVALPSTGEDLPPAPADGFYVFTGVATSPNQACTMETLISIRASAPVTNWRVNLFIPVIEGTTPRIHYDLGGDKTLIFVYAEGAY